MNLVDKFLETKSELAKVKKLMIFEFANHVHEKLNVTLSIKNHSFVIEDNDLNILSINDFFSDEFSDYHYHAGLLYELSDLCSIRGLKDCNLHSHYFLNYIDVF